VRDWRPRYHTTERLQDFVQQKILLVDCPDAPGLISIITGALFKRGCNIVRNQEFVEPSTSRFFMRTVFTDSNHANGLIDELVSVLPADAHVRLARADDRKIVVMATREHHCLGELLMRHEFGELGADIQAVVSNHESLGPLVERFGIPYHHISAEGLSREEHEASVLDVLNRYEPDYIALAKYMRILTPDFVGRYSQRIINIHHSFLPAFIGASPYKQAFERGVKLIGATAHFVDEGLDEGPIIAQDVIHVDHSYSPESMAQAGRDVEKLVLAKAIQLVLEERVFLVGHRTIVFD
jgi:formyltetrahydrofolate deformylase